MPFLNIGTIQDDQQISDYDSDTSVNKNKPSKKLVMNKDFLFEADGGDLQVNRGWEYSNILSKFGKEHQKKQSVDDRIKEILSDTEDEQLEQVEDLLQETVVDKAVLEQRDIVKEKRAAAYFAPESIEQSETADSFLEMNLSRPLLKAIAALGYTKPTNIQNRAVPLAMKGLDICGAAETGSGKTAAFVIPVLERLMHRPKTVPASRVLVLVPTRELAVQCMSVFQNLAKFTDVTFALCVGGLSTKIQEAELRKRPDVVIATPGRLIDHVTNSPNFTLDTIDILIIDEADRILQDGFAAELNEIIRNCPKNRQTMLFSATMTDNVDDLIRLSLNRPVRLFVDSNTQLTSRLTQEFIRVRTDDDTVKAAMLLALCSRTFKQDAIVFFGSKAQAHFFKVLFGLNRLKAAELHGNLTQVQRLEALEQFKNKKVDFLLATDLASRGLDIQGVATVINYDMPKEYQHYVHRVGRTARAGMSGVAVSFITEQDRKILKMAIKNTSDQVKNRIIPQQVVASFVEKMPNLKEKAKQILMQEKQESMVEKAEMQVQKMQNMLDHQDEIMSRPKRQWFEQKKKQQPPKDKAQLAKQAVAAKHFKKQARPTKLTSFKRKETEKPVHKAKKTKFDREIKHFK